MLAGPEVALGKQEVEMLAGPAIVLSYISNSKIEKRNFFLV